MLFGISWEGAIHTISQILSAGVAITAFSLLLYSFAFNLREGVVRAFIIILLCVTIVYTAESLAEVSEQPNFIEFLLKLKWVEARSLPCF